MGPRSTAVSAMMPPPSARASCINFSEIRARRRIDASMPCALARKSSSERDEISRCVCARAPAIGVLSSCALFAVKLRSASRLRCRRCIRLFTASVMGSTSSGRFVELTGDKSPALRAPICAFSPMIGCILRRTSHHTPNTLKGRNSTNGTTRATVDSIAASRRCVSGSAISMKMLSLTAASPYILCVAVLLNPDFGFIGKSSLSASWERKITLPN